MTEEEFLTEIKKELGFMPYEKVVQAEKYFEAYFNGTEPDEKIIERLGTPKCAAQTYYRTHIADNPQHKPEQKKRSSVAIWITIIVLVLLLPIIVPLVVVVGSIAFAIIIGIVVLFTAIFLGGIALWLGGAAAIIKSLFIHIGFAGMLMQIGIGLIMFGIGLLMAWFAVFVCVKFFPWIIRKIVSVGSKAVHGGASK